MLQRLISALAGASQSATSPSGQPDYRGIAADACPGLRPAD